MQILSRMDNKDEIILWTLSFCDNKSKKRHVLTVFYHSKLLRVRESFVELRTSDWLSLTAERGLLIAVNWNKS